MPKSFKVLSSLAAIVLVLSGAWWLYDRKAAMTSLEQGLPVAAANGQNGKIDVLTYHYDNSRTGADPSETALTPQNVNAKSFGRIMTLAVDGDVYAQPLYKADVSLPDGTKHDVLYVATANDSLYAFDADTGAMLWKDSFIDPNHWIVPVPVEDTGTLDITPEIGIIGTPVIDASTQTIYLVSKSKDINPAPGTYEQYLHAIDLATGQEKFGAPELISATSTLSNGTTITFDSQLGNQRGSLLLSNGVVYIDWASHGDVGDFHGWVMGYDANDVKKQTGAFIDTPYGARGGIWMSGGGLASDGTYIYGTAGDGDFSATAGMENYGMSTFKLTPGTLKVADYFAPLDAEKEGQADKDSGTGGVHLITDDTSSSTLLVTGDKQGRIFVLDQNDPGGFSTSTNNDVQEIDLGKPLLNNVAYFDQMLYVGGNNLPLQAFKLNDGKFSGTADFRSSHSFGTGGFNGQGTNPIVSSNGDQDAIVWALDNSAYGAVGSNKSAVLYAYDATNLKELYDSSQDAARDQAGAATKFTAPVVANGKVFVPGSYQVTVYGLLK